MSESKAPKISIVVFIDALGWEVLKGRRFMEEELPLRRKLRSVFGFSSACIPSILTGLMPRDHRHWSFFYYSPETSPFKPQPTRSIPSFLTWVTTPPTAKHETAMASHASTMMPR